MGSWVNSINWNANWITEEELPRGGQASTKKVKQKDTGEIAFLKILNKQNESDRRMRFLREATAYDTCQHPNMPKLIETNAQNHLQDAFKMYIVTDFIEGSTLENVIQEKCATFEDAVALTLKLLSVVEYFHDQGWVHRDIKHDNIILRGNSLRDPVLVDFGLAYKEGVTLDNRTRLSEGLGNRFLNLPELAIDSVAKQDPRSDIAFIGGILFYCLTGQIPSQLHDSHYKMPHQRDGHLKVLQEISPGFTNQLLGFFDKTFSYGYYGRFASAAETADELRKLLDRYKSGEPVKSDDSLETLRELANSSANQEMLRRQVIYDAEMKVIESVHRKVGESVFPTYVTYWSGYQDTTEGFKKTLGFSHMSTIEHRFAPTFYISIHGDEIIVRMDDQVVHRTAANKPVFDDNAFRERVEDAYRAGMKELMSRPIKKT